MSAPKTPEQLERKRLYMKEWWSKNKEAKRAYAKAYREAHKEQIRETKRKYNAAHPERHRKSDYGLTPEAIESLREAQGGLCGICQRPLHRRRKSGEHVDHCHKTGRVRGLLCHSCNTAIGHLGESLANLRRAIEYLEKDA